MQTKFVEVEVVVVVIIIIIIIVVVVVVKEKKDIDLLPLAMYKVAMYTVTDVTDLIM